MTLKYSIINVIIMGSLGWGGGGGEGSSAVWGESFLCCLD